MHRAGGNNAHVAYRHFLGVFICDMERRACGDETDLIELMIVGFDGNTDGAFLPTHWLCGTEANIGLINGAFCNEHIGFVQFLHPFVHVRSPLLRILFQL